MRGLNPHSEHPHRATQNPVAAADHNLLHAEMDTHTPTAPHTHCLAATRWDAHLDLEHPP